MKKYNICIIGLGWLGHALGKFLSEHGHSVKGSTTSEKKLKKIESDGMEGYILDLPQQELPKELLEADIAIITIPPSVAHYLEAIDQLVNQLGNAGIPKVIFISSTSVYPNTNGVVTESDAIHKESPHSGVDLYAVEKMFTSHGNFEATIIRFAGLYGPERNPAKFLAGKIDVSGAESRVNLIHQDDCVGIIHELIKSNGRDQIFNACAPAHPDRMTFYTSACKKLGLEPPVFTEEAQAHKIVNGSKLINYLNYTFIHPDPLLDVV